MNATDKMHPKTQGGRSLRRGYTFDPECWRTTHRLRVGHEILSRLGVKATHEHGEGCARHPAKLSNVVFGYRERVVCTCGRDTKGPDWPEWATGEMFDLAYRLADEVQTERGAHERKQAADAKAARETATVSS